MNNVHVPKSQPKTTDLSNDLMQATRKTRFRTLLHEYGFRKERGIPVYEMLVTMFLLPFTRQSFAEGIVNNQDVGFGKDAVYDMLNSPRYNWRRLVQSVAFSLWRFVESLADRDHVLIIDSTSYNRNRSKKVELLSRVKDHATQTFIRGFRMETVAISDGYSLLPVDFALLANASKEKRFCGMRTDIDKRTCGYQRRKEALQKATDVVFHMVARVKKAGFRFRYILMDSWYGKPAVILRLMDYAHVICMIPKGKTKYRIGDQLMSLTEIYASVRKKRGRAQILASAIVQLNGTIPAKIVFVRHRSKKGWLAILSTDISLPEEEVVRTYGKRWDIEVFFKMAKQHLRMDSEIQSRRFDALVAHVSIVFLRYLFISWRMRIKEDQRSFGEVFRATLPEIRDVTLLEALKRIAATLFEIATAKAKDGYVLVESLLEIFEQSIQLFFQIPPDSKLALVDS